MSTVTSEQFLIDKKSFVTKTETDVTSATVFRTASGAALTQTEKEIAGSYYNAVDDEIDYALFNRNHHSGSSYYDLEGRKTPILEAFTNNTSNLKTKLLLKKTSAIRL